MKHITDSIASGSNATTVSVAHMLVLSDTYVVAGECTTEMSISELVLYEVI